jgi:hypothetical protein
LEGRDPLPSAARIPPQCESICFTPWTGQTGFRRAQLIHLGVRHTGQTSGSQGLELASAATGVHTCPLGSLSSIQTGKLLGSEKLVPCGWDLVQADPLACSGFACWGFWFGPPCGAQEPTHIRCAPLVSADYRTINSCALCPDVLCEVLSPKGFDTDRCHANGNVGLRKSLL